MEIILTGKNRATLNVYRDHLEIPVWQKVPDPEWKFIDAQGHVHMFDGEDLPTLEWYDEEQEATDGEFGWSSRSSEYDAPYLRCKKCGQEVEPHYHQIQEKIVRQMGMRTWEGSFYYDESIIPYFQNMKKVPIKIESEGGYFTGKVWLVGFHTQQSGLNLGTDTYYHFKGSGELVFTEE